MVEEVTTQKYSQQDEQRYILASCAGSERKTLLDIGAWDPFEFSNSRALIESGWKAVLVEPSPVPLQKLLAEYGNSENVKIIAAVARTHGVNLWPLHVTDDAVSTTEEAEYAKWKDTAKFSGILHVPAISVAYLLELARPDFINIDAEGTSVELFQCFMSTFQSWERNAGRYSLPRCICVEHNGYETLLMNQASALGYELVHLNDTNLIVRR